MSVTGTRLVETGGSAHVVKDAQLRRFSYDDPHQVLLTVPGVYVRPEDGMGLRPNIGIRGANSDRSKKVTLMEDGVLVGPAPYSAPAAYYFPLIDRMRTVRVVKGPGVDPLRAADRRRRDRPRDARDPHGAHGHATTSRSASTATTSSTSPTA